jgi:hypothetical protein
MEPLADREIVTVDMIARGDVRRGESNDLPIPPDLSTLRHVAQRELVPRRDHLRNANLAICRPQHSPRQQRLLGNGHRVTWVQEDRDLG